jgi:glycosyltransferase involved in cell wall biosynthesis
MSAHTCPLVSVVIPAYNHERFVGNAIQSVLDQSYPNFEIVVTDDGSCDGTPDVIRQFADSRISLEVFQQNCGASVAANSAIRRSRGAFVCTLSSDDLFLPGKLEKQVAFLTANSAIAAVFGMPRFIDERGTPLPSGGEVNSDIFKTPILENLQSRQDWLRHFFFQCNCLCHPTAMMRRSVYDDIGLFDPRLANLPDFDMWVRLCMKYEIHVMPDELTAMRILNDSRNMSAPRRDSILRSQIEYFEVLKHYRRLSPQFIREIFARDIAPEDAIAEATGPTLLAQIALSAHHPAHQLFALDTMFEGNFVSDTDYPRLHGLTGSLDVFGIDVSREPSELRGIVNSSRLEIDRLAASLAAARGEADRLSVVLGSTKAALDALMDSRFYKVATSVRNMRMRVMRLVAPEDSARNDH